MLEQAALLVHPWTLRTVAENGVVWERAIADAAGRSLGCVRFEGNPQRSWFSWLRRVRMDVLETDDASHLMTLTRAWGVLSNWEIVDAEDRPVGNVYAKTIVSSDNVARGHVEREASGAGLIRNSQLRIVARFARTDAGILHVTFEPDLSANPFERMLVLGAILTLDAMPKSTS
jgi:hypothetical protein